MKRLMTLLFLGFSSPAFAQGWMVDELSTQPSRSTCMTRAENTFHSFASQHGGARIFRSQGRDDWTVAAYDLAGQELDGLIICPIESGKIEPFLIVFESGPKGDLRHQTTQRLRAIWDAQR